MQLFVTCVGRHSIWIVLITTSCLVFAIFICQNVDLLSFLNLQTHRHANIRSPEKYINLDDDSLFSLQWQHQNRLRSISSEVVEVRINLVVDNIQFGPKEVKISREIIHGINPSINTTLTIDNTYSTIYNTASPKTQSNRINFYKSALRSSDPSRPEFLIRSCSSNNKIQDKNKISSISVNEIPKIIHQTWKTHSIPQKFLRWQSTWKKYHPHWEHKLWSDEDNMKLVNSSFPWFYDTYMKLAKPIMKSDAVRYCYMYKYGGFYADLDVECLASHLPLAQCGSVLLPLLGDDYKSPHNIPNAWLASVPNHPFWTYLLEQIVNTTAIKGSNQYVEAAAGPAKLYEAAEKYSRIHRNVLTVTPIRYVQDGLIFPFDWRKRFNNNNKNGDPVYNVCVGSSAEMLNTDECKKMFHTNETGAYSITYWAHSWG